VDALLTEIARPAAEIKSKQARADFLLSVLKSRQVSHLEGSDGQTVHAAATQALKNLGPLYSRKIPSEPARSAQPLRVPIFGIVLALIATVGPAIVATPEAFKLLRRGNLVGVLLLILRFSAPGSAILGGWSGQRWLQVVGVLVMVLASLGCLLVACWLLYVGNAGYDIFTVFGLIALGLSLVTGLSAYLLARPWFAEDEEPDES
jgi:hypothetical protein